MGRRRHRDDRAGSPDLHREIHPGAEHGGSVTAEEALSKARVVVEQHGWSWREPSRVQSTNWQGEAAFEVLTNFGNRGMNARVVLRATDGEVLHAGYLSR